MNSPRKALAFTAIALGATSALAAPAAFADAGSTSSSTPPSSTATSPAPAANPATGGARQADTLAAIKARAAAAVSLRTSALNSAIEAVDNNHYLTPGDRTTIRDTLNSDLSGLNALAPVIQADTTVAQARSDLQSIFTKYRVFALAVPQSRFAAAADDLTGTVVPRLTDAQQRLQALLSGKDSGKNSAVVQSAMTDLANRIAGISSDTSGLSAGVLAYTPAQWNADHELLSPSRSKLQDARADAKAARADVRTVVRAIRS